MTTNRVTPSARYQNPADYDNAPKTEVDLPLPNIYFCHVTGESGITHSLYVAADYAGAAIGKLQDLCGQRHGFRPYRSNSVIKLRRLRLRDMLESPEALGSAMDAARELGDEETLLELLKRPNQIMAAAHSRSPRTAYAKPFTIAPTETTARTDSDVQVPGLIARLTGFIGR